MTARPAEITMLLKAWQAGDASAFDRLTPLVYQHLRALARRRMRRERPDHSLQSTALVNEAYLRLVDVRNVDWRDRAHFLAVASEVMRRILVDAARKRRAAKHGGHLTRVDDAEGADLDDLPAKHQADAESLCALDDALNALERFDARRARVVKLRFFGGLSVEETAVVIGVSAQTVMRDWKLARAWLIRELQ